MASHVTACLAYAGSQTVMASTLPVGHALPHGMLFNSPLRRPEMLPGKGPSVHSHATHQPANERHPAYQQHPVYQQQPAYQQQPVYQQQPTHPQHVTHRQQQEMAGRPAFSSAPPNKPLPSLPLGSLLDIPLQGRPMSRPASGSRAPSAPDIRASSSLGGRSDVNCVGGNGIAPDRVSEVTN